LLFFHFPFLSLVCSNRVGGLSAINGVAGAFSDDLPLLCISGGPNTQDVIERNIIHHTIGKEELYQQSRCFEPVVKKAYVIHSPKDAPRMIDEAIFTAIYEKKPVYLEIPVNLSLCPIPEPNPTSGAKEYPRPVSDSASLECVLDDITKSIESSTRPVLIAGSKIGRKTNTTEQFKQLVEKLDCAVAIMPDAKGLFPENHSNYIGRYWGTVSSHRVAEVIESSDLVILAGPNINDYTTVGWSAHLSPQKCVILGPNYVKFGDNYYYNVQLQDVLEGLTDRVQAKSSSLQTYKRYTEGNGHNEEDENSTPSGSDALTVRSLKSILEKSFTSDTTLVVETGDAWFIGQSFKLPEGAKYHVQMQYGSIGWSVGALLGIALAEGSSRRVIAMIGDGSFQLTAQEVSTMIRNNVKATIILLNNDGYTIEVQIHDGPYNDIKRWNYAQLMDVFNAGEGNGLGIKAQTVDEFAEALKKSESHDGVTLIECGIARDDCTAELLEWGSRVSKANGRR
jgi:pyruvate decarboxylase